MPNSPSRSPLEKLAGWLIVFLGVALVVTAAVARPAGPALPRPRNLVVWVVVRVTLTVGIILALAGLKLATGWRPFRNLTEKEGIALQCYIGGGLILTLSAVPLFLAVTEPEYRVVSGLTCLGTALLGVGFLALGRRKARKGRA